MQCDMELMIIILSLKHHWTPLMEASRRGSKEKVELLLKDDADPNAINEVTCIQ